MATTKKTPNFLKDIKKGALTKSLPASAKTKKGTIKKEELTKLAKSGTPLEKKRAQFAINASKWNKK